jgi:hypothetical protein
MLPEMLRLAPYGVQYGAPGTLPLSLFSISVQTPSSVDQAILAPPDEWLIKPHPFPNGTCRSHWIAKGDTCSAIAKHYDIKVREIEEWNHDTYKWIGISLP